MMKVVDGLTVDESSGFLLLKMEGRKIHLQFRSAGMKKFGILLTKNKIRRIRDYLTQILR